MSRPRSITPMRSATVIASLWSWVTMTKVSPSARCSSINSNWVSPRSFLSSAAIGSSSNKHARALDQATAPAPRAGAGRRTARAACGAPKPSSFTSASMSATRRGDFAPGQALLLQAEGDIGFDGQMRKQRVALKHHVDRPPIRRHRRQIDTVEQNAAGIRPLETGNQAQQRGLAATRRSEQGEEFAFINIKRELIDDGGAAEALGQRLDAQQRTQIRIGPRRKISFRAGDLRPLLAKLGMLAALFNANYADRQMPPPFRRAVMAAPGTGVRRSSAARATRPDRRSQRHRARACAAPDRNSRRAARSGAAAR